VQSLTPDQYGTQTPPSTTLGKGTKPAKQICNRKTNGGKTLPPSHTNNTKGYQPTHLAFPNWP